MSVGSQPVEKADQEATPGEPDGGFRVLACPESRLCGPAAERFARDAAASHQPAAGLVIDLAAVNAVDAVGLGALAGLARTWAAAGGELRFCCPTPGVRQLIAAAGLHRSVEVYSTRPPARAGSCP